MWLYSTFDNVDGKQARRTNSSSPLGELFDHVCDALNCSVGAIVQVAAMGLGVDTWHSLIIPFLSIFAFYLSTWEEYHTGTLFLGYINGPTEGLIISCCTMIISGIYGPGLWKSALSVAHMPPCFWSVAKASRKKGYSILSAYLQVSVIVVYFAAVFIWLLSPFSISRKQHYIVFILTIGVVFGMIAGNIILAQLVKGPFPYYTILMLPLLVGSFLFGVFPFFLGVSPGQPNHSAATFETLYLYAYCASSFGIFFYWSDRVIFEFCNFLGIRCFSIVPPKDRSLSAKRS
jgi:ethanolaminephosphotransferase